MNVPPLDPAVTCTHSLWRCYIEHDWGDHKLSIQFNMPTVWPGSHPISGPMAQLLPACRVQFPREDTNFSPTAYEEPTANIPNPSVYKPRNSLNPKTV
uniref:Uncharacterized protein n=1 Tax=Rhizophora mucronata TaxID=61149 RepID=A0A2P2JRT3_RHIMU